MMLHENKANAEKKDRINKLEADYKREWNKRRRITLEIVDAIYENCCISKKKILVRIFNPDY